MRSHLARLKEAVEPVGIAPAEALALLVLLAGALSLTTVVWWGNRPAPAGWDDPGATVVASPAVPAQAGPAIEVTTPAAAPPAPLVVHVTGAVLTPGLVQLPADSRVADAIQAAGGLTATAAVETLNLARPVMDGEQIRVPIEGEELPPAVTQVAPGPEPLAGGVVDLNTATAEQLQSLPGVGPVMADRIVAHRTTIGGFVDVAQLLEVPGIGPARFAELEPLVAV